jgi:hypothetical protein
MILEIIDSLNQSINSCLAIEGAIYHGLVKYYSINKEKFPLYNGNKVCLNDNVPLLVYHYLVREGENRAEKEKRSFGKTRVEANDYTIRSIFVAKEDVYLSSDKLQRIIDVVPSKMENEDYRIININNKSVITDHDTIVNREWKEVDYSKHKCKFVALEVTFTLTAVRCLSVCLNG